MAEGGQGIRLKLYRADGSYDLCVVRGELGPYPEALAGVESVGRTVDEAETHYSLGATCAELSRQVETHCRRGEVYCRTKEYEKAVAEFEQVVRLQPDHMEAHLRLSRSHLALGNNTAAQAYWRMAAELGRGPMMIVRDYP